MKEKCKARVFDGWRHYGCSKNATRDGYCGTHHPDAVAKRKAEQDKQFRLKFEQHERKERIRKAEQRILEMANEWADTRIDGPLLDAIEVWREVKREAGVIDG